MKGLAFSSNAFKQCSLAEAIDVIAGIGYEGVELMADVPHAYPLPMDAGRLAALRGQLKARRLGVSNVNAFTLFAVGDTYHPTWIEEDAKLREVRIAHTVRCVELAGEMECGTVSVQPGGPLIGTGLKAGEAAKRFAGGLERVIPVARRHGVVLAVEPEPGLLIETSGEYLEFKRGFFGEEPAVRMNCDIGHLFCVGEDPARVIEENPEEIAHVHLEDIGANRVHQHLMPGKGAIDFGGIFGALGRVGPEGYRGWVTVELYPYESGAAGVARGAFEFLRGMVKAG